MSIYLCFILGSMGIDSKVRFSRTLGAYLCADDASRLQSSVHVCEKGLQ